MKKFVTSLCALAIVFLPGRAGPVFIDAAPQRKPIIKLASPLPENTIWGAELKKIAGEWAKITGGEIELRVVHGQTDEGKNLALLRQNQIQISIFTSIALNSIAPEIMALSIPMLIHDNNEFDAVLRDVRPTLNSKIEEKGEFVNLVWAKAGWVRIFSTAPVVYPDDLRKLRVGTNPDEEGILNAFRAMGFNMVPVGLTAVTQQLTSRRIDAIYQSPTAVAPIKLYKTTKYMNTIRLAPFMGGALMNQQSWKGIEKYRPQLQELFRKAGTNMENSFLEEEEKAIANMRKDGLIIHDATPAEEEFWYRDLQRYLPDLVNRNIFNKEMYNRIQAILENYRGGR
ncbi:MAG: TRAP transporter substrate-binding protein DctP [Treponema sp.]|nr:TRAP transporter substrate-binding protein DctP [Treponema sp.]